MMLREPERKEGKCQYYVLLWNVSADATHLELAKSKVSKGTVRCTKDVGLRCLTVPLFLITEIRSVGVLSQATELSE